MTTTTMIERSETKEQNRGRMMSRFQSVLMAAAAAGDTFRRSLHRAATEHRDPAFERRLDERRAELAAPEDCDLAARALAVGIAPMPARALLVERIAAAELALETGGR